MTWPTREIVDFVFIFIYALLLPFTLYNLIKHLKRHRVAFTVLLLFVLLRIAGNAVLVAGYQESGSSTVNASTLQSLLTAGFIMQGIGYSFLVGAALRFYVSNILILGLVDSYGTALADIGILNQNHAVGFDWKQIRAARSQNGLGRAGLGEHFKHPSNIIDVLNLVALILLIVGLNSSMSAFSPGSVGGSSVSATAKAGSYLYCALTAGLIALYIYHLVIVDGDQPKSSRVILTCLLMASIPMAMRSAYSAYKYQSSKVIDANVWIQMVFQYIAEVLAVVVFVVLGFRMPPAEMETKSDEESPSFAERAPPYQV